MPQNNDDEVQRQFPKEFADIEQIVSTARQRIQELNTLIENVPDDRGPVLDHRPKGAPPINRGPDRPTIIKGYERQIGEIKKDTTDKVEERTKGTDPKLAKQIKDKTAFLIDEKSLFNRMDRETLANQKGMEKSGDHLHDKVNVLYFERLNFKVPNEEKKPGTPKEKGQGTVASAKDRMDKFLDNSNFVKATEPSNNVDAPTIEDVSKGKDDADKDID